MLIRQRDRAAIPLWVDSLHRLVLHGTPDSSARDEILATWNSHAGELFEDQTLNQATRALKIFGSGASHSLWRLTRGPATTVSTGLLMGLVGVLSIAFVASDLGQSVFSKNGLAFLGLVLLGFVLIKYPNKPPLNITAVSFALLIPAALWTVWEYTTAPEIWTEWIAAFGAIVCIAGAVLFTRSARKLSHSVRSKAWQLFALGIGAFAVSNFIGATQYESADVRITAAVASWIEVLLVASMLRNARAETAKATGGPLLEPF